MDGQRQAAAALMDGLERIANGTGSAAREARRTLRRRAAARVARGGEVDDFVPLVDTLADMAARLAPGERRRMGLDVATELRDINADREKRNVQPGGEAMVPRKTKGKKARSMRMRDGERKRRRGLMFRKAWQGRFLRKESNAGGASVGFAGAMARIMEVHQYGLRDHVNRSPDSPEVQYARRTVLGMTNADRVRILDRIVAQVSP